MKNIISFSLWGDNPKYTIGAVKNAQLIEKIYGGTNWIGRFYCSECVPTKIINKLKKQRNVEVIKIKEKGDWSGLFWRFYALSDEEYDIVLSRDVDSRISLREKIAVESWINSDKEFHIMRDHPLHNVPILGGMWGCKSGILNNIEDLIKKYGEKNYWQGDQEFLKDIIYPLVKDKSVIHDAFYEIENHSKPFPVKRNDCEFVGQVYTYNDEPNFEFAKILKNFIEKENI